MNKISKSQTNKMMRLQIRETRTLIKQINRIISNKI